MPWFSISGSAWASIVARKLTLVLAPAASDPPCTASAPAPRRTWTMPFPESYSVWSSPGSSVKAPMFGPDTIRSEPGT
jgi:hypothetical protein